MGGNSVCLDGYTVTESGNRGTYNYLEHCILGHKTSWHKNFQSEDNKFYLKHAIPPDFKGFYCLPT